MCGIFGLVVSSSSPLAREDDLRSYVKDLFLLSESRGKEAAGVAFTNAESLMLFKAPVPASRMLRDREYRKIVHDVVSPAAKNGHNGTLAFIGHSRLVTDGLREVNRNNQPVIANGIVGIHNGIIVNHETLWKQHDHLERRFEVDSEVIFALLRDSLAHGNGIVQATQDTFSKLEGAASIAALFVDADKLLLATNNGSLYYRQAPGGDGFMFASENYIVNKIADRKASGFRRADTVHVKPGEGVVIDLKHIDVERFRMDGTQLEGDPLAVRTRPRRVIDRSPRDSSSAAMAKTRRVDAERLLEQFPYVSLRDALRRCVQCVLPETMPFVDFDSDGVCSYCRNYRPVPTPGREALEAIIGPHRRSDGRPDCIVGVSGGRDSMYGLHYIKCELGLNPIAYTYDWGMVTDLARRNVSRICGKLGIEHILVSADIPRKRGYIRRNVEAWLARPSLGTVPLFMAGDKAYFHHLKKVRSQVGVDLSFLCENLLERTNFKTGFANIPPFFDEAHVYTLPVSSKVALASFYAREFWRNPRYLNVSLADTAMAFAFYYLIDRDYQNLYAYVPWEEKTVESVLLGEYNFELAEDTKTTWRIGDGTAAFYNYIYYAIAGMTENDTFRSNQIRAGAVTRDEALEHIDRENRPRFPSIQWYLDTIGLEQPIEAVLKTINAADKLYSLT